MLRSGQALNLFQDPFRVVILNLIQDLPFLPPKDMNPGYTYITTNRKEGVLYIGVTSDMIKRISEHKQIIDPDCFTAKYNCKKLVYFENCRDIEAAIRREKQLKNWHREWKIDLIETMNPNWDDLFEQIIQ